VIVYVLHGKVNVVPASSDGNRQLNIPAECLFGARIGEAPVSYLSSVNATDPANAGQFIFDHCGVIETGTSNPFQEYMGLRLVNLAYTLTTPDYIEIEFELVWKRYGKHRDEDVVLEYAGS
jgi:hypothetical protein